MQKILVVDREPDFVRMAREALSSCYEVSIAPTRREALEKAKKESPDMIILGFLEPQGDAFKLHEELRKDPITKNIPLLVVDVSSEEHTRKGWRREEGIRMDAEDYVSRPIEPTELAELVEDIFERVAPKSVELKDTLERMEKVLKRVEKIEKALVP